MFGVIMRYVKDPEYAQDIMQEVFIKVYGKLDTYDSTKSAITTWMHSIAVRSAINHLRKKNNYFLDLESSAPVNNVENTGLESLEAEHILKLITGLPEIQRTIFNLNVMEGYSHKEK